MGCPALSRGQHSGLLVSDLLRDAHPEKHVQKPVATTKSMPVTGAMAAEGEPRGRPLRVPGVKWKLSTFRNTECFSYIRGDVRAVWVCTCTHTHIGVHTHTHPAQMQPHTPTTPLPSRMFFFSPTPQLPLTEGSVLRHSGLCSLTCGTALLGLLATLGAPFTARPGQQSAR